MRLTRQVSLVIALVAGLAAAVGAYIWFARHAPAPRPVPESTIEIPVPIRAIPAQTELRPAMFAKRALPKVQLPSDVVSDTASVQGRVSLVELPQGEPVRRSNTAAKTTLGLAFGVKRGYRAMAVALDIVGDVGDFVKPGNRVDVLVAFVRDQQVVVRTVAQNIEVLSVNREVVVEVAPAGSAQAEETKAGSPPPSSTPRGQATPVTLALTPAQAQVVLASDSVGKLRLALRAAGDSGVAPLPPANSWSLVGPMPKEKAGAGPPQAQPPPPGSQPVVVNAGGPPVAPQAPRRPSVEVIRGGQREIVVP